MKPSVLVNTLRTVSPRDAALASRMFERLDNQSKSLGSAGEALRIWGVKTQNMKRQHKHFFGADRLLENLGRVNADEQIVSYAFFGKHVFGQFFLGFRKRVLI